ncbi:MAG: hypothetical protein SPI59_02970 [Finegoldia sp.]|nr:hypothetical protein [Finegoldia sp.]
MMKNEPKHLELTYDEIERINKAGEMDDEYYKLIKDLKSAVDREFTKQTLSDEELDKLVGEKEFAELRFKANITLYEKGILKSNKYDDIELKEIREFYETHEPTEELGFFKKRWLYEIKRVFEKSKTFKDYPDAGLAHLERFFKYGG